MRALLLYNPNATATTSAVRDSVARTLSRGLKLDVEPTQRRHHAGLLTAGAAEEGYEAVFVLGGDGTVNEAMQGLAKTHVKLGIIPGGSTNVWARALGLPNDAEAATAVLLGKLAAREDRRVTLGTANERYFGFAAGFGYDAEVVRAVERRYRLRKTVRQWSFLWCGLSAYANGYDRTSAITVTVEGQAPVSDLRSVVCCNSQPFTYLGRRPAHLCPNADLDAGLAVTALTSMSLPGLLRLARLALRGGDVRTLRFVRTWDDEDAVDLESPIPLPLQVDGDYVGETASVALRTVPHVLTLVA